jgi:hypothetical protein
MIPGLRRGAAHSNLAASAADCASSRSVVARQGFVFAATAAACLVTLACETYCDASFGEITVKMLATIIVVMGLAQTLGNQAKQPA